MWRFDHKTCATLGLMTLASLVGTATVHAQSEAGTRRSSTYPARASAVHPAARGEASYARARQVANNHRELFGRSIKEPRPAAVSAMGGAHLAGGGRVHEVSRDFAGGRIHVVRYDNSLSGTVERTIRPGLTSRTFV